MGQQQPVQKKQPQKPMKQQVKQYTKSIQQTRRQNARQKWKVQYNKKNLQKQLKKKIEKNQPKQSIQILAQQVIKQNQMVAKYDKLDGHLQNVQFQLQEMVVNESMKNVMAGMAKIMSGANQKMKNQNMNQTIKRFMNQKQRMNVMNQMVSDFMGQDDDLIQDQDVDALIAGMTQQQVAKKQKKIQMDLDDYQNQLNDI